MIQSFSTLMYKECPETNIIYQPIILRNMAHPMILIHDVPTFCASYNGF